MKEGLFRAEIPFLRKDAGWLVLGQLRECYEICSMNTGKWQLLELSICHFQGEEALLKRNK